MEQAAQPLITVLVPTRERPRQLCTLLTTLDALRESDDVRFGVRIDEDDPASRLLIDAAFLPPETQCLVGPPPPTTPHKWNDLLECALAGDTDILCLFGDDALPVSPGWDTLLRWLLADQPAVAWQNIASPASRAFFAMRRDFAEALGPLPTDFPFWFAPDTWVDEVHYLATGGRMPIDPGLSYLTRHGRTRDGRDFEFWFRFFSATRPERVAAAERVVAALELPELSATLEARLAHLRRFDEWQLGRCDRYERELGDHNPPSDRYLTAKAAAEARLAKLESHPT